MQTLDGSGMVGSDDRSALVLELAMRQIKIHTYAVQVRRRSQSSCYGFDAEQTRSSAKEMHSLLAEEGFCWRRQASALEEHPQSQPPGSGRVCSLRQDAWQIQMPRSPGQLGVQLKCPMETTARTEQCHVVPGNIRCRAGACTGVFGAATRRGQRVDRVSVEDLRFDQHSTGTVREIK
jgi:hypothetical protein